MRIADAWAYTVTDRGEDGHWYGKGVLELEGHVYDVWRVAAFPSLAQCLAMCLQAHLDVMEGFADDPEDDAERAGVLLVYRQACGAASGVSSVDLHSSACDASEEGVRALATSPAGVGSAGNGRGPVL